MMKLPWQHAVITGGSSGIGLACAKILAQSGCKKITLLARSLANLQAAKKDILDIVSEQKKASLEIHYFCVDVSSLSDLNQQALLISKMLGTVDLLITAAGVAINGSFFFFNFRFLSKMYGC